MEITFIPSPNFEPAKKRKVDMIVIHSISLPPGQFGGDDIIALFTNTLNVSLHPSYTTLEKLRVSAHYLIRRNGDIIQFVNTDNIAWHAGKSEFRGRTDCNKYSIGIELEGDINHPFELNQYISLASLSSMLMQVYPNITMDRIVGHNEIAPERKSDPGEYFDWILLYNIMVCGLKLVDHTR